MSALPAIGIQPVRGIAGADSRTSVSGGAAGIRSSGESDPILARGTAGVGGVTGNGAPQAAERDRTVRTGVSRLVAVHCWCNRDDRKQYLECATFQNDLSSTAANDRDRKSVVY